MENLGADARKRLEYASERLYSGKMTVNQMREYLGLPPVNDPVILEKKIDKGIQEVKDQQAELDRRTKIEREAERLISQCRFEDAMKLLAILD